MKMKNLYVFVHHFLVLMTHVKRMIFFLTVDDSFLIQVYTIRIIFKLNGNVLAFDMFGCLLCFGQPVQFIHLFTLHTFGTYYLRNLYDTAGQPV